MSRKSKLKKQPPIGVEPSLEALADRIAARATEKAVAEVTRVVDGVLPIIQRAADAQAGQGRSLSTSGSQFSQRLKQRQVQQAYGFNDPHNYTTPLDPRWRPFSRVSTDSLRVLARRYDVLAACILHLKSEVIKTPIKVVPVNDKDKSDETKRQIEAASKFLGVTGGLGGYGFTREEYEGKVLDDLLIIGAGASWLQYDTIGAMRDGAPDQVVAIDAATIRPIVTAFGFPPDDGQPHYEQWVMGTVAASFRRNELIYRGLPIFAQSNSPYYLSMVELLISVVFTALKADEWNRTWLTDGNTPDWWMKMPDGMSPDQALEWVELFEAMMSGDSAARHKIKLTPGEPKQGNSRKDSDFDVYEHWLMERTCSVCGVNPASIGHHSDTYKDSQEIALKSTSRGRVAQLLAFRNTHYTDLLERKGWNRVKVVEDVNDEDAKVRAERQKIQVESGFKTINEIRQENGQDPSDDPAANIPFIASGLVPLAAISQQLRKNPPNGQPDPNNWGARGQR